MAGLAVLWAVEAERMDLERMYAPYVALLTGLLVATTAGGDLEQFRDGMAALFAANESTAPSPTAP